MADKIKRAEQPVIEMSNKAGGQAYMPGASALPEWRSALKIALIYAFAAFYFTLCVGSGSPPEDAQTRQIVNYSHLTAPILAVGIAVLPVGLLWLAPVVFTACFVLAELVMIGNFSTPVWTATGMLASFVATFIVSLIGGCFVRFLMARNPKGKQNYYPEKVAMIGAFALIVCGVFVGSFALWFSFHDVYDTQTITRMQLLMSQRIVRLALLAGGMTLLLFALPSPRALIEILFQTGLFAGLGILNQNGVSFIPSVDAAMLAVVLILARPVHITVAGIMAGLCLYVLLTGAYLNLPIDFTPQEFKDDVIGNFLYLIVLSVAVLRVKSSRVERNQLLSLERRTRAQELARFGYYLFDIKAGRISFDSFASTILGVPAEMDAETLLRRLHPDDRDAVSQGMMDPSNDGGASFTFRFAREGPWHDTAQTDQFNGFSLYEGGEEGHNLTFGIVVDVTQEYAKEEQLRVVLEELSQRQGQQTQIFSMISHELRTPAAALSMMVDELDEGRTWTDIGPQMRAVLEQLLSILSDMRQTVRPEQNLPIRSETLRPADVITSVRDALRGLAVTHGTELTLRLGAGAQEAQCADRVRLVQTLSNVVKNAILHAQASEVIISYEQKPGPLGVWTVSDNGRNIPHDQRQHLFQPFARGDEHGAQADGSGLGLFISKAAIELLGGTLEYIERPLSGAEFCITLPLSSPETSASPPPIEGDLSRMNVVLLEDSEITGALLSAQFEKIFGKVTWLRSGTPALDVVQTERPDLIISDLFMPQMCGDDVAQALRAQGYEGLIIGMTAADIDDDIERFKRAGANDVVIKPLREEELRRIIAAQMSKDSG